jgi:primosomal protein N' (replication factor Y)
LAYYLKINTHTQFILMSQPLTLNIVQVAVPAPLRRKFDYLLPEGINPATIQVGMRVLVPFGKTQKIALVLGFSQHTEIEFKRLKPLLRVLDVKPVLPQDMIRLLNWVASYYHHPVGEVYQIALPVYYRRREKIPDNKLTLWRLTETGRAADWSMLKRAVRQRSLLELLKHHPQGMSREDIADQQQGQWQQALKKLQEKQWIEFWEKEADFRPATRSKEQSTEPSAEQLTEQSINVIKNAGLQLNSEQQKAVTHLLENDSRYHATLIDGITGSGKTEVYLAFIEVLLQAGKQILILVPEIGLTPQLIHRFEHRFQISVETLHSAMNNTRRMQVWKKTAAGEVRILIGTRSAVFTPMPDLGAIIIDEEHDISFKQQDGIRYSARDIAFVRAHNKGIPIVLGSATPSMESLYLCQTGQQQTKMSHLTLRQRAGLAKPPEIHIIDIRGQSLQHGLSRTLIDLIGKHLQVNNQVLLFQNRRGYAPVLLCNKCGWISHCHRCDAKMTYHHLHHRLRCHHCQSEQRIPAACPSCGNKELSCLGVGTERIEKTVCDLFPDIEVIRIDRDTTRRKDSLQVLLDKIKDGNRQILIGTQMLAKGHHFPNVTLVALLDIDQGLYSIDFRAQERLAQLITQVAGRAGREIKKGQVILQTAHPEDEMLNLLLNKGYSGFAKKVLAERKELQLPPFSFQALIRTEANKIIDYQQFLQFCYQSLKYKKIQLKDTQTQLLGPVPAPMERKAGKFRGQLLIQSGQRKMLHQLISHLIKDVELNKKAQRLRWSIDIDPQELY